jgi:hypothetical protein
VCTRVQRRDEGRERVGGKRPHPHGDSCEVHQRSWKYVYCPAARMVTHECVIHECTLPQCTRRGPSCECHMPTDRGRTACVVGAALERARERQPIARRVGLHHAACPTAQRAVAKPAERLSTHSLSSRDDARCRAVRTRGCTTWYPMRHGHQRYPMRHGHQRYPMRHGHQPRTCIARRSASARVRERDAHARTD